MPRELWIESFRIADDSDVVVERMSDVARHARKVPSEHSTLLRCSPAYGQFDFINLLVTNRLA